MSNVNHEISALVADAEAGANAAPMTLLPVHYKGPAGVLINIAYNPSYGRFRYFIDAGNDAQPVQRGTMLAAMRWQCRPRLIRGGKL